MSPFTVSVHHDSSAWQVQIAGELDLVAAPVLADALAGLNGRIVTDCSGLEFVDSSGLAVLLAVLARGDELTVVRPTNTVRRTIEVAGVASRLLVADSPT